METGRCECTIGMDGSPCWHQFIIWSNGISYSINFLPRFDSAQRQRFAEIAIGATLNPAFYDSIHRQQDITLSYCSTENDNSQNHPTPTNDVKAARTTEVSKSNQSFPEVISSWKSRTMFLSIFKESQGGLCE